MFLPTLLSCSSRNLRTSSIGNGCFQSPSFQDHVTKKRRALGTRMGTTSRESETKNTHAHTIWAFSLQAPRDQETTVSGDESDLSLVRTSSMDFLHGPPWSWWLVIKPVHANLIHSPLILFKPYILYPGSRLRSFSK